MTWWAGIPGLDCHDRPDSQELAARIAALACAARLHPINTQATRFADTAASKAVRKFLPWLLEAKDAPDAYLRRLALAFACDVPRDDTNDDQVLKVARFIHTWLAELRRRARASTG